MTILLDTNACIAVMNNRPQAVREKFRREVRAGERMTLSSISLFELWFGIAKSAYKASNEQQLADFCRDLEILSFNDDDARSAAFIRADRLKIGRPIGAYDLLIASQALRRGFRLVSADIGAFSTVVGLRWENWAA